MNYATIEAKSNAKVDQELKLRGINLTDNYTDGQIESCKGISTDKYPYITTQQKLTDVTDEYCPDTLNAISMFAWEKLFIVTDSHNSVTGGYRCYYGKQYVGDVKNTTVPKQYAVIGEKLVVWPDKVYFNLYDAESTSYELNTAPLLANINSDTITYKIGATS